MTFPLNETFETAPPVGFWSLYKSDIYPFTATHNAGAQALDLQSGAQQALWRIDEAGALNEFSFTADLELLADTAGGYHMGLWLTNTSGDAGDHGPRYTNSKIGGVWGLSVWKGSILAGSNYELAPLVAANPPYSLVGARVLLRAEYRPCLYAKGFSNIYFFLDGVLVAWLPNIKTVSLYAGVLLYGTTVRVHSIGITDPTTEILPELYASADQEAMYRYTNPTQPPAQITMSAPQKVNSNALVKNYRSFTRWQSESSPLAANYGGVIVSGIVTIQGTAAARKVRLYNKSTGQLVGQVMSGINGFYTFTNLDPSFEYFAVAHDHTRTYNAVIQDMIKP